MKYIMIALIVLTGWACSDSSLGDDYYFLSKEEAVDVGYPGGAIIYRSKERNSFHKIVVTGDVVEVVSNDAFIAAKQIDINTESLNYFLIDKTSHDIFGPLGLDSLRVFTQRFDTHLEIDSHF